MADEGDGFFDFLDENDTVGEHQPPRTNLVEVYVFLVTAIIIFCIEFGNILTLVAVCRFRRLRKKSNMLIISLAVTDAFVGCSAILFLVKFARPCEKNGFDTMMVDSLIRIPILVSIFHLIAMGVDKFIAVMRPFYYESVCTSQKMWIVIGVVWLAGFVTAGTFFFYMPYALSQEACLWLSAPLKFVISLEFALYMLAMVILMIVYTKLLLIAREHARKIADIQTTFNNQHGSHGSEGMKKGTRLVIVILVAYILTWLPYFLVNFVVIARNGDSNNLLRILTLLSVHCGLTNSWINVIIYGWINHDFREAYRFLLCCGKKKGAFELDNSHSTP